MAPGLPTTSRTSPECRRSASPASPREPHRRGRRKDGVMSAIKDLGEFTALDPFFRIIEQGLDGLADGWHVFSLLADDATCADLIPTPGSRQHGDGPRAAACRQ